MWSEVVVANGKNPHYGYGWMLENFEGLPATFHYGQVAGFNTEFVRLTDQGIAIIVFTNRYRVDAAPITKKVLHTFLQGLASSSK
jgi:hypothetical protein